MVEDVSDFGETAETATEGMATGEGPATASGEPTAEGTGTDLFGRFMSSSPNPPVESVESPFNPDAGGLNRVMRGIQKMGDIEGLPAIVDIVVGMLEFAVQQSDDSSADETDVEGGSLDGASDIQVG